MSKKRPIEKMLDAKVIATSITGFAAPIVIGLVAELVGIRIAVDTATAIVGPAILATTTFVVGWLKRSPRVEALLDFYREVTEHGDGAQIDPAEPDEPTDRSP